LVWLCARLCDIACDWNRFGKEESLVHSVDIVNSAVFILLTDYAECFLISLDATGHFEVGYIDSKHNFDSFLIYS
jgi:hypothetical protein